ELAAAWFKLLSPDEVRARLERNLPPPAVRHRDRPSRQQTVAASVAWSYDLLPEEDRRFLRSLSLVRGAFTIETAGHFVPEPARSPEAARAALLRVAALVDRSLLVPVPDRGPARRYRMLETVRAYAAERLDAHGEREGAIDRLKAYCRQSAP